MEKLRYAPLIRVSSERQKKKGESLATQKAAIIHYVQQLGGVIPESCWQYTGAESATPAAERILLDKLLSDASQNVFDCVIVNDASRWSRDNLKSKSGLQILRDNGIRFYTAMLEQNLFDPSAILFLGMSAEIGEYQSRQQALRSIQSRIARSKKNMPATGRLVFGRTYDRKTDEWHVIEEKQKMIETCAQRYLSGESLVDIARSYGICRSGLYKILMGRCSDKIEVSFRNKALRISEKITLKVPALLDKSTIKALRERATINKLYVRGNRKTNYLLSGYLYCKDCGLKYGGCTLKRKLKRYRHSQHSNHDRVPLIDGHLIENTVILKLVQMFGDSEMVEAAIRRATPHIEKINQLETEHSQLTTELARIRANKDRIIDSIANGLITDDEAREKLDSIRNTETSLKNRLTTIQAEITTVPDSKTVKSSAEFAVKMARHLSHKPELVLRRPDAWKRRLIEKAFTGQSPDGKPLGVYIHNDTFEIKGNLMSTISSFPLSDDELIQTFGLAADGIDLDKELDRVKSKLQSQDKGNLIYILSDSL